MYHIVVGKQGWEVGIIRHGQYKIVTKTKYKTKDEATIVYNKLLKERPVVSELELANKS